MSTVLTGQTAMRCNRAPKDDRESTTGQTKQKEKEEEEEEVEEEEEEEEDGRLDNTAGEIYFFFSFFIFIFHFIFCSTWKNK